MDAKKNAVIDEIWRMINGICGISPSGRTSHDSLLYLKIFKGAANNGINIGCDAIVDAIYSRYGDNMKEPQIKALKDVVSSWKEWSFFLENYERV